MSEQERDIATRIKNRIDQIGQMSPGALKTVEIQLQGMELGLMAAQTLASMDKPQDKQAS